MYWLPIGSWEPHGPHLPYDTDTQIATQLAHLAAAPTDVVLPPLPFGTSWEHRGTGQPISLRVATAAQVVADLAINIPDPLVIVNAHGGNAWLSAMVQELNGTGHPALLLPNSREWTRAYQAAGWPFGPHEDMHAGALETSLLWIWAPDCIQWPLPPDHAASDRPLFHGAGLAPYGPQGYIGFPQAASREAGQRAIAAVVADIQKGIRIWQP